MKFVSLILLSLLFVSCGESPILNHEVEKNMSLREFAPVNVDDHAFKKSGLSFTVDWAEPPKVGESRFTLKIWKSATASANGPFVDPKQKLHIFLWMPTMGHGSAPVKITRTAPGEYLVTNVYFIMGGKWELKFQLLENGKAVDETVLTFNL